MIHVSSINAFRGKGDAIMRSLLSLIIVAIILSFTMELLAAELVLYFPFDETGDKVIDKSGKGNDGVYDRGKPKRVAGKDVNFGQAMEFDAASRITVNDSKSLTIDREISFVMWVKKGDEVGGVGTLPRMISRASDLHELAMDSGHLKRGTFAIYFGGNPGWTTCVPVDMQWHHIAVTGDGTAFTTYLDGENVFQIKAAGPGTYRGNLYIGSRHDLGTNEYFKGWLDEIGVFAGVLTKNEIIQIMNTGVKGDLLSVSSGYSLDTTWGNIKTMY